MCFAFSIAIPLFIFYGLQKLEVMEVKTGLAAFISILFASIYAVHFSNRMKKKTLSIISSHKHDHASYMYMRKLGEKSLDKSIINALIYTLYFVVLLISQVVKIQFDKCLFGTEIDAAILQAFVVYIAYDKVVHNFHHVNWDSDEMMKLTLKALTVTDNDEEFKQFRQNHPMH